MTTLTATANNFQLRTDAIVELLAVLEIAESEFGKPFKGVRNDLTEINVTSYPLHIAKFSEIKNKPEAVARLHQINNRLAHLRSYSDEFMKESNDLYNTVNEPANRLIEAILIKHKVESPFLDPTDMFPNPYNSHLEMLFFDSEEQRAVVREEIMQYANIDLEREDNGRGCTLFYSLKVWDEEFKKLNDKYLKMIKENND